MPIKNLAAYFDDNGLYDRGRLEAHCEKHLVRLAASKRFPHLGILHYMDAAIYDKEWTDFTLSCRGLVVDFQSKKLLAIPFFKFFNLGEKMAPSFQKLAGLGAFEATEKLDGSLGIAFHDPVTGKFRVTTRGSLDSEHGEWATANLPEPLRDKRLLTDYTLMFEIITSRFQIVVNYREKGYPEGLYLVGIRENAPQRLLTYNEVGEFARQRKLMTCKTYPFKTLDEVMENTKGLPYSDEGYVLRFASDDELMLKIKSPEYLRVHKFLSNLDEKSLLEVLMAGQERNVLNNLGIIPEEHRDDVVGTIRKFQNEAAGFLDAYRECFEKAPKTDRKTFALWVQSEAPREYAPFLFKMMDGKPVAATDVYQYFYRQKKYAASERSGFLWA